MLGGNKKKYFKKHNLAFSRRSTELVYYSFPVLNPEKIIELSFLGIFAIERSQIIFSNKYNSLKGNHCTDEI